jgi:DNA-binding transcriptional MerR regulator
MTYTITELAREFDITPRAIRFYEDQGLIAPKREGANGRVRVYTARERTRLKLTLRGKRLGLSLSEIKSLVDMYESPKDSAAQMKRFLAVLARHRAALEQQREDLDVMLAEIAFHEKECRRALEGGAAAKKLDGKNSGKTVPRAAAKQTSARSRRAA